MIYVLYHSNCYDGFGAAFAAWKRFGDAAKYIPVSYGKEPPELDSPSEIYVVDFSYDKEILLGLADRCRTVVLDHHKTAEEKLKGLEHPNLEIVFDMNRSGALIAWEYFHRYYGPSPADSEPVPAPMLIQHISDRDLWRFKLDRTKEIHSALVSHPMDFVLWDQFDVEKLKVEGAATLRMYAQIVSNVVEHSFEIDFEEHRVPVVNTAFAWSEIGDALKRKFPEAPFVMSFTRFHDQTMFSVRSQSNFDSTVVAKKYGGGGHAQASGFKLSNCEADTVLSRVVS